MLYDVYLRLKQKSIQMLSTPKQLSPRHISYQSAAQLRLSMIVQSILKANVILANFWLKLATFNVLLNFFQVLVKLVQFCREDKGVEGCVHSEQSGIDDVVNTIRILLLEQPRLLKNLLIKDSQ